MNASIDNAREAVGSSFWFVPGLMMAAAAALAFGAVWVDGSAYANRLWAFDWLIATDVGGARILVSAIASSMIGVAGVVFSITVVVLSVASGQLGHRLLRSFMRQNTTQVSLGTFTATFLYCLVLLVQLQVSDDGRFTPHLSISLAVLLAVVCLGVLVFYIHHVAMFIQADFVIADVSSELEDTIEKMYPEAEPGDTAPAPAPRATLPPPTYRKEALDVPAASDGHIQTIDEQKLAALARRRDVLIVLHYRPGKFVIRGTALAHVWPCREPDADLNEAVNSAFAFGPRPTPQQDVEYAIRQLVEMAVRALSPGINDPFTAMGCIDKLTTALGTLLGRRFASPHHLDDDGRLRLVTRPATFTDLLGSAFDQIRQNALRNETVSFRLLESLELLAELAHRSEDRAAVADYARTVADGCLEGIAARRDRAGIERRRDAVLKKLPDVADAPPATA